MSKEKSVPKYDPQKLSDPEEVLVLRQHRAKPHQSDVCKLFFPGEKYIQRGMDKAQVLMTGMCTLDLNAKVPENTKRKAPLPGEEKHLNTPDQLLSKKIDKLIDTINDLVLNKKK